MDPIRLFALVSGILLVFGVAPACDSDTNDAQTTDSSENDTETLDHGTGENDGVVSSDTEEDGADGQFQIVEYHQVFNDILDNQRTNYWSDDGNWLDDPDAPERTVNEHGTYNSVVCVE